MSWTFNPTETAAVTEAGAIVPWDKINNQPADINGWIGRAWIDAGRQIPDPYVAPPPPIPQTVTPRQARLALLGAGLLEQVQSAVTAAGGATEITWEYATEINRSDALVVQIGASLNLTDAQIDALFVQAASL